MSEVLSKGLPGITLDNEPFYWPNPDTEAGQHAVLMLHGLGGGSYELRPIAERLHKMGFSVQGLNYPGHDQPAIRMPPSVWPEWYGHIEAAYQQLQLNHQRISLVGFSTGCPLALKLAHQYPVDRLVLLSPFLEVKRQFSIPLELMIGPFSQLWEHIPRLTLPIRDREIREQAKALSMIETFNLRSVRSALELIREVKPLLANIQNPTMIIQSHQDTVVDPRGAHYLMQHLGSSHKSLHWLEHSNHIIPLDVEREMVFSKVLAFFQKT